MSKIGSTTETAGSTSEQLRSDFVELASALKDLVGVSRGFALLMRLDDGCYHYASTVNREDVRKLLGEWLSRAEARVNVRDSGETERQARRRVELEEACVELGTTLNHYGHLAVLFLFDFGVDGNLAWHSSAPDPKGVVRNFLKVAEGTKATNAGT